MNSLFKIFDYRRARIRHYIFYSCFFIITSCKTESENRIHRGKVNVNFTNKKIGYSWNFTRDYKDSLIEVARTDFPEGNLSSVKFFSNDTLSAHDYKDGKIYFLDNTFNKLLLFSSDEKSKEIMYYDYHQGRLRLYDFTSRQPKIFKYNQQSNTFNLVRSLDILNNSSVYRVGFLKSDGFIYANTQNGKHDLNFIIRSNHDTSLINDNNQYSLAKIMSEKSKIESPEMAYDGDFIFEPRSNFIVYGCKFGGVFFSFDVRDGNFKYAAKTVDKTPIPVARYVKIAPNIKHLENTPNLIFFPSYSLYKDCLFVLNYISESKEGIVDIYDIAQNGRYKCSIFIPSIGKKKAISISVLEKEMIVLYESNILVRYLIKNYE